LSRDGSGIYSLPAGNPVVTGTTISSATHNTTLTDIANALTASIAKDGQTTPTANLPMGTYRHTGVSNGTARDHYLAVGQFQDNGARYVGSVSGTNTITGTLTPAIAAYAAGMEILFSPANNNTGAVTLALNGLTAKSVYKHNTSRELAAGDFVAGALYKLHYNGSSWYAADVPGVEFTVDATEVTLLKGPAAGPEIKARWSSGTADRQLKIGRVDNLNNFTEHVRSDDNGWRFIPTTAPSSPSAGHVYYDSGTNKLRCYNGSTWNDLF